MRGNDAVELATVLSSKLGDYVKWVRPAPIVGRNGTIHKQTSDLIYEGVIMSRQFTPMNSAEAIIRLSVATEDRSRAYAKRTRSK